MPTKDEKLITEIRDRFKEAYEAEDPQNEIMLDDLHFLEGDQWPASLKAEREAEGRPCLVINKLPTFCDQVSGDIRQNTPSIKVKPVDDKSDPDTAEVFNGIIRNIQVMSNADIAYDTAVEAAVACGKGAFRIVTDYSDDDVFDQDIKIKRIKNAMTIYWDPASQEWDKSDARYCFITERIPRDEFKTLYPDAQIRDAEGGKDTDLNWSMDKSVRVAEYFKKISVEKKLILSRDPMTGEQTTGEEVQEGWEVVKERTVATNKIHWYKTNGAEILEEEQWVGKYIPIVMVYGKETNIEGKTVYKGVIRHAKDPQRLYNYYRSTGAEVTSLAPKSPYLVTQKMIGNYQRLWDQAHKRNYPYLPFDIDPSMPAFPQRADPIHVNTGIQSEVLVADQELHDTTGLQLASLGKKSNELSGRAIMARQREGDVANFAYYDNLVRALIYAGRILIDLIPKIYDTPRITRLLNEDGSDRFVNVNQPFLNPKTGKIAIYDLTVGKYDVVVSIGPSYNTQREETADNMMKFVQAMPNVTPLIADLLVKSFDWPGAEDISKRLRKALPPGLAEDENGGPASPPPNPPQPPPDPRVEMEVMAGKQKMEMEGKRMQQEGMAAQMNMEQEKLKLQGLHLDNKKKQMEIDKIEAEFVLKATQAREKDK